LITVHPLCEKLSDTVYKGYAAIRTVSKKLFTLFGMGGRLKFEREKAAARQRKRTRKEELKGKAKIDLLCNGAVIDLIIGKNGKRDKTTELQNIRNILNSS